MLPNKIYLASQSPRRQSLLHQVAVAFELLLPLPDENAEALELVHEGELPLDYVKRVCGLKLQAAIVRRELLQLPDFPILCADTTVALDTSILGKPLDADDARLMLSKLSGQRHWVHTAIALAWQGEVYEACSTSEVVFSMLREVDIASYVASEEPFGKAGSYAIQGRAAQFIRSISGSPSGIMGLPLFETMQLLKKIGFSV